VAELRGAIEQASPVPPANGLALLETDMRAPHQIHPGWPSNPGAAGLQSLWAGDRIVPVPPNKKNHPLGRGPGWGVVDVLLGA